MGQTSELRGQTPGIYKRMTWPPIRPYTTELYKNPANDRSDCRQGGWTFTPKVASEEGWWCAIHGCGSLCDQLRKSLRGASPEAVTVVVKIQRSALKM